MNPYGDVMPKLNSGNERFLKERSVPYLISKDGTCQIYLGEIEDSEILRPTEADKVEAEKLIESLGHYFKMTSIAGMLLALIMYIEHSINIVILAAIIEIIMILVLYKYQKRQNNRIMHLISTKIPIESGSKEYIMILEPIQKV
jgi:Flp pilus assembly protein TadB